MFLWKIAQNSGTGTLAYFLVLVFLYCQVIVLDWGAYFAAGQESQFSFLPKYIISLSSFLFVWLSSKKSGDITDYTFVRIAFLLIIIADTLMVIVPHLPLNSNIPFFLIGLGFFFLTHCVLIIRVARWWPRQISLDLSAKNYKRLWALLFSGAILFIVAGTIVLLIRNELLTTGLFIPLTVYMVFLTLAVWMGVSTLLLPDQYPVLNARMTAIAMLSFFACDFSIGFSLVSTAPEMRALFLAFTWLFYTPCLFLLALSGIKLKLN